MAFDESFFRLHLTRYLFSMPRTPRRFCLGYATHCFASPRWQHASHPLLLQRTRSSRAHVPGIGLGMWYDNTLQGPNRQRLNSALGESHNDRMTAQAYCFFCTH